MLKVSSSELFVLKQVFQSRGKANLFTIYRKSKISFNALYSAVTALTKKGLLNIEESVDEQSLTLALTQIGKEFVQIATVSHEDKSWREVPKNMRLQLSVQFKPYIPDITKLDKRFFQAKKIDHT